MVTLATEKYVEFFCNVCGELSKLCLQPSAFESLDHHASLAALSQFYIGTDDQKLKLDHEKYAEIMKTVSRDHRRLHMHLEPISSSDDDELQKLALQQSLRRKYNELYNINDRNNKRAVQDALELYTNYMRTKLDADGGTGKMSTHHNRVLGDAQAVLEQRRNRPSDLYGDCYKENLLKEIDSYFEKLGREYNRKKKASMDEA